MLSKKLLQLKGNLIREAKLAENMVEKSINGLVNKDENILKEVIDKDEPLMNRMEIELDELCTNLIALYQPRAVELRTILMILKMNNDLERIGDLAVNISESSLFLIKRPPVKPLIDIPRMAQEAIEMLNSAITSFVEDDPKRAKSICKRDAFVDSLRDQILRELITFMSSDLSTIERSIHLLRISRNLERVADLATNIAEDVIFAVKGEIIKHHVREDKK